MQFSLHFDMDNAAFGDTLDEARIEAARILKAVQERVDDSGFRPGSPIPIHDINGNKIGAWEVQE